LKLPPELRQIHAVLRRFALPDENHWDIPSVVLFKNRILIDVHFMESRFKFPKQRPNRSFGFLTKMAPRTRVQSHVAWPTMGKARIFRRMAHGLGFEYFMNGPE
jgi:hypothetical protein